jgi:putative membrane protein
MVSGHKDAIDKFEKEAKDGSDTEIKNWANSMLPTLRSHLDAAMKCQEECKAMEKKM